MYKGKICYSKVTKMIFSFLELILCRSVIFLNGKFLRHQFSYIINEVKYMVLQVLWNTECHNSKLSHIKLSKIRSCTSWMSERGGESYQCIYIYWNPRRNAYTISAKQSHNGCGNKSYQNFHVIFIGAWTCACKFRVWITAYRIHYNEQVVVIVK